MQGRITLHQILAEQDSNIDSLRSPEAPPSMEPPPTENEPEDEEDFDPRGILAPRGAPVTPIEYIPPRDQLRTSTERQLAAFEALRADLGFSPEAPRPPALDPALVAALVQRWGDDFDPYEILRYVREHDPAGYSTLGWFRLMFTEGDLVYIREREDGPVFLLYDLSVRSKSPNAYECAHDPFFQINPARSSVSPLSSHRPDWHDMPSLLTSFQHVLLRFSLLPEETALRVLLQIPVWVRAIYRRPGYPVEALLEIDARTAGEFHGYMAHLGPHLAAVGADVDCLTPTAFSRLPVARRNDTIEDILYMDTRPIPVDARPIVTV